VFYLLNSLGTIIAIIAGLLTIYQIIKEFFNPNSNAKIQQHNVNGNNFYTDNSTHINTTTKTTHINNPTTYNSNNDDVVGNAILVWGIGLVILTIMLTFYSITYNLIPLICLILLTISIYRGTKLPFENINAKIQWASKNIIFLIVIIILLFIPESILNIINQIQVFRFESFKTVLDSLTFNIKLLISSYKESMLLFFNLVGRMIVSFGLLYYLFISIKTKTSTHKSHTKKDLFPFLIVTFFMLIGSNIEFVWNFAEPLRSSIENWFNPTL